MALLIFGAILIMILWPIITKKEENDPFPTKLFFSILMMIYFLLAMSIFLSLKFERELKEIGGEIKRRDIFSLDIYSALIKMNKTFYIIACIYLGFIAISLLIYLVILIINKCC